MTDQERVEIEPGDIVQISPEFEGNRAFAGCLMIVTEVFDWGVQGYVQALGQTRVHHGELAYIRLQTGDVEPTGGRAVWIVGEAP
jgi:hypothetical protein